MSGFHVGDHVVAAYDDKGMPIDGSPKMEIMEIAVRYEARCRPLGSETAGKWFKTLGLKRAVPDLHPGDSVMFGSQWFIVSAVPGDCVEVYRFDEEGTKKMAVLPSGLLRKLSDQ